MVGSPSKVYRQLIDGGDPLWYSPSRVPRVSHTAFMPTKEDTDGLSLIDSGTRSEVWAAHRIESPFVKRRVAVLAVDMLVEAAKEAGLCHKLVCDPDALDNLFGKPSSHLLATHINRSEYDNKTTTGNRANIKSWVKIVASKICNDDVLPIQPLPSFYHCYRPQGFTFRSIYPQFVEFRVRLRLVATRKLGALRRQLDVHGHKNLS